MKESPRFVEGTTKCTKLSPANGQASHRKKELRMRHLTCSSSVFPATLRQYLSQVLVTCRDFRIRFPDTSARCVQRSCPHDPSIPPRAPAVDDRQSLRSATRNATISFLRQALVKESPHFDENTKCSKLSPSLQATPLIERRNLGIRTPSPFFQAL